MALRERNAYFICAIRYIYMEVVEETFRASEAMRTLIHIM